MTKQFVPTIFSELLDLYPDVVRVNNVGDMYSKDYIRKWFKIAERHPATTFFAYTRCWRQPALLQDLLALAALPNFQMSWSTDVETHAIDGAPPAIPGIGVNYWRVNGEPVPLYATHVWKDQRETEYPEPGLHACPQGAYTSKLKNVTCSECRWCFEHDAHQVYKDGVRRQAEGSRSRKATIGRKVRA